MLAGPYQIYRSVHEEVIYIQIVVLSFYGWYMATSDTAGISRGTAIAFR